MENKNDNKLGSAYRVEKDKHGHFHLILVYDDSNDFKNCQKTTIDSSNKTGFDIDRNRKLVRFSNSKVWAGGLSQKATECLWFLLNAFHLEQTPLDGARYVTKREMFNHLRAIKDASGHPLIYDDLEAFRVDEVFNKTILGKEIWKNHIERLKSGRETLYAIRELET